MQDLPPAKRHPKDEIGRLRTRVAELERHLARQAQALHELPVAIWTAHDPECRRTTGNRYADEVIYARAARRQHIPQCRGRGSRQLPRTSKRSGTGTAGHAGTKGP